VISVMGAKEYADYGIEDLRALPFVEQIGHVQFSPAAFGRSSWGFDYKGEQITMELYIGDTTAFNLLGFRVLSRNAAPVSLSFWLTESTMRHLGVGYDCKGLSVNGGDLPVCGIIKDFQRGNLTPEETAGTNLGYYVMEPDEEGAFQSLRQLLVKVNGSTKEAVKALEQFYRGRYADNGITVISADAEIAQMYGDVRNDMQLIALFTLMTLILSVMALIAISTWYTKLQARNVSIRKIFGLERRDVFRNMLGNFLRIVAVAAMVAIPIGYVLVHRWLQDYSYRIGNSWWIYALVLAIVLLVAATAVSWQAVRLMNTNPAEELKKE